SCNVDATSTIMSWRGAEPGAQAAKQGHDVIMTPNKPMYFDHYQTDKTWKSSPRIIIVRLCAVAVILLIFFINDVCRDGIIAEPFSAPDREYVFVLYPFCDGLCITAFVWS
ncbi:MAG: family 20 glycosylhydrolase, partial [Ruminococcus sp.]|nr:family 20 glycosylhydrolase [Ruminococcus sp.]